MIHPGLLNFSYYSFLKSTLSIKDIINFAVKNNHKYVVISDFENAHGWVEFYKEAKKNSLIPIFGLYVNYELSYLLLIAKNKAGYLNLLKIASKKEITEQLLENIILIHIEGEEYFLNHKDRYVAHKDIYIKENKFEKAEDYEFYCLLRAINNNSSVDEEVNLNRQHADSYLYYEHGPHEDDLKIKNLYKVLESCEEYEIFCHTNKLNFFKDPEAELRSIVEEKFQHIHLEDENQRPKYRERIDAELDVIIKKKFCEYFLIVYDAIKWAKQNSICIGPGRGSVCGLLLSYLLEITEIDPFKYGLLFERFLNPDRNTTPDIDVDVANNKRDLLLNYLKSKYSENNVALICTYQTFKSKNSIREVAKAYGISSEEIDFCIKNIPHNPEIDFSDLNNLHPSLQRLLGRSEKMHKSIIKIADFPKNLSVHAAGIIISSDPLSSIVPINKGDINTTQWSADELKNFGLIKFDFLALNYLAALSRIQDKVEKFIKRPIIWSEINTEDPLVYETLNKGKNAFIFQFENPKIKALIQKFQPTSLLDLSLVSAIHRPGASDQIPILLARKASINSLTTLRDKFFNFLEETYGLLIYQEQLMKLVVLVTGCSFGEADTFRRNIGVDEEKCRKIFFEKGHGRIDPEELEKWWGYVSKFAKYGFNKSHSLAYAVISYRLLWLKTYYPVFFYEELLSFSNSEDHLCEIQESGFSFAPPTYKISSYQKFQLHEKKFFFPINKISGISSNFETKFKTISFQASNTLDALREFIDASITESDLILLIRSGYFSSLFKPEESGYYWETNLPQLYEEKIYVSQGSPLCPVNLKEVIVTKEIKKQYEQYQTTLLGIDLNKDKIDEKFFSKHPNISPISTIISHPPNTEKKYIGFLCYEREGKTFKDNPFLWIKLSDNFFISPLIAYFEQDMWEIRDAVYDKCAALVTIEKQNEFLKATKIKVFKRDE